MSYPIANQGVANLCPEFASIGILFAYPIDGIKNPHNQELMMKTKINSLFAAMGILLATVLTGCAPHYYYLQPMGEPINMETIISLSGEGRTDKEIIKRIDESGTVIFLRTDDILRLHNKGVSNPVIDHLITTKEWTLLALPGIYNEISPERIYQIPRSSRDIRQPRSLVPIAIH